MEFQVGLRYPEVWALYCTRLPQVAWCYFHPIIRVSTKSGAGKKRVLKRRTWEGGKQPLIFLSLNETEMV